MTDDHNYDEDYNDINYDTNCDEDYDTNHNVYIGNDNQDAYRAWTENYYLKNGMRSYMESCNFIFAPEKIKEEINKQIEETKDRIKEILRRDVNSILGQGYLTLMPFVRVPVCLDIPSSIANEIAKEIRETGFETKFIKIEKLNLCYIEIKLKYDNITGDCRENPEK